VNFQNIQNAVNNAAAAVTTAFDFSRWENAPVKQPVITDLELSFDQLQVVLSNQFGLSELLQSEFPHLSSANSSPKALLKLSIVFESLGRDASYDQLANLLNISCNSVYQRGIELREAYKTAFGITLTATADGLHLCTINDGHEAVDRLRAQYEKQRRQFEKLGEQIVTCQRLGHDLQLSGHTQALLTAVLTKDEEV
jgi:hypothetical protein